MRACFGSGGFCDAPEHDCNGIPPVTVIWLERVGIRMPRQDGDGSLSIRANRRELGFWIQCSGSIGTEI